MEQQFHGVVVGFRELKDQLLQCLDLLLVLLRFCEEESFMKLRISFSAPV